MASLKRTTAFALLLMMSAMLVVGSAQSLYTPFPPGFRNTQDNELSGTTELRAVFKKLRDGKEVKVMQIGDSHIRGNHLPRALSATLASYFPNITFAHYGINGAWAKRFNEQDMIQRVAAERPDLVIVSFGTNEAHASAIDTKAHAETMALLTSRIKSSCPGAAFLFTTPPGSYLTQRTGKYTTGRGRNRRTRYRTTKIPNTANTAAVAQSIVKFCRDNHHASWDLFTIAGGASACANWLSSGMMALDQVHYQAHGYELQGKLLGEAIHKAYTGTPQQGKQTRMMHGSTPQEQKPYSTVKGN